MRGFLLATYVVVSCCVAFAMSGCGAGGGDVPDAGEEAAYREASGDATWVFESALRKGQPGAVVGQSDYCRDPANKCDVGEGNCRNGECLEGLVCVRDAGARYALSPTVDVCMPTHCRNNVRDAIAGEVGVDCGGPCGGCSRPTNFANGSTIYCSATYPCGAGQGDCGENRPCAPGLTCSEDAGAKYGLAPSVNVCEAGTCNNGSQDSGETGVDCGGPCGSCSRSPTARNGGSGYCSTTFPCVAGEGHCDGAVRPCAAGLVCGDGNGPRFGLGGDGVNACVAAHCTDGVQNFGEIAIDCGGACGACSRPATVRVGSSNYCTTVFKCSAGQGNCTGDATCVAGTTCERDRGAEFGLNANIDVCVSVCGGGLTSCDAVCVDTESDTNNCGACGNECGFGEACDGGECVVPSCTPESNVAFCARLGRECGSHTGFDNCGSPRYVSNCGACDGEGVCEEGVCSCTPESDAAFCAANGAVCGSKSGVDGCGNPRTVSNCGSCGGGTTCIANQCGASAASDKVAVGSHVTCRIVPDSGGLVQCWGLNNGGTLGEGSNFTPMSTVMARRVASAEQITAGSAHFCVRRANGGVTCWGQNSVGQLGLGGFAVHGESWVKPFAPTDLAGLSGVAEVRAGATHTCARLNNGSVTCWGASESGQGGTVSAILASPTAVPTLSNASALALGASHSCALLTDGTVKCWGANGSGQLGDGTNVGSAAPVPVSGLSDAVAIGSGFDHTCAVRAGGSVVCWGENGGAMLGFDGGDSNVPVTVAGVAGAVEVDASSTYTCARLSGGGVKCWGANAGWGVLGNGSQFDVTGATAVGGVTNASSLSTGFYHACAQTAHNGLVCWGSNRGNALRRGEMPVSSDATYSANFPATVVGLDKPVSVAVSGSTGCVSDATGVVKCWGRYAGNSLTPVTIAGLGPVSAVFSGAGNFICALTAFGEAKCWGSNFYGQLGDGTQTAREAPVTVQGVTQLIGLGVGGNSVCGISSGGSVTEVYCWGRGTEGQLGNGAFANSATAVRITTIDGVQQVSVGDDHACALMHNDVLKCWGSNAFGQWGNGSSGVGGATPQTIISGGYFTQIAAGYRSTCGRSLFGVFCWGENTLGQLGIGTVGGNVLNPTPVDVGVSSAVEVSRGVDHGCAVRRNGTAVCWGNNSHGQNGNGATVGVNASYVPYGPVSGAASFSTSNRVTCLLMQNGAVKCAGNNEYGQVGVGATSATESTPVDVTGLPGD